MENEDVAEYFKRGLLGFYKNKIEKNYEQKTLRDRVTNFNNVRRETRNTLIFQKRQIDENMTPSNTPEPAKIKKTVEKEETKKPSKRAEMLHKWKMEKEKRQQEEKRKAKPVFKVCHVPVEGFPNLENVNTTIKGKPIKPNVSHTQSQFAPPNHVFRAPKAIKPIYMNTANNSVLSSKSIFSDKKLPSKVPNRENAISQRNTRATTSKNQRSMMDLTKNDTKSTTNKPTVDSNIQSKRVKAKGTTPKDTKVGIRNKITSDTKLKQNSAVKSNNIKLNSKKQLGLNNKSEEKLSVQNNKDSKSVTNIKKYPSKKKLTDLESNESDSFVKSTITKSPKISRKSSVRAVGWDRIEILGNQNTSEDINTKTPKTITKKYNKTPRKGVKLNISEEMTGENNEVKGTPKSVNTRKSKRLTKSNINSELKESDQTEQKDDVKSSNFTVGSATGSASPDYPIDESLFELNSVFQTPEKITCDDSPVYISPFVTISRGKTSDRKKFHDISPELEVDIKNSTSPKAGADYFQKKLNNEINRIEGICDTWDCYKNSNNEIPEEACDMIDVAIGQSKLLISKKFKQFGNLIEQCKKCEYIDKPITCEDLHGFWDMIYMQVEDLNKRFNNLNALKANNWQEVIPEKKPVVKRGRGRPKKVSATSTLKNLIKAARDKKLNSENKVNLSVPQNETKEFDGVFYKVKSPVITFNDSKIRNSSSRRSLRVSLLSNQMKQRASSPGLTMMKVSQAIKYGDGITPSKSILKNDLTRSAKRITKSVLFKDNLEEDIEATLNNTRILSNDEDMENGSNKENVDELNLITFSPVVTTRRSKRLSKIK